MKRIIRLLQTDTLKDTMISFLGLGATAGFGFIFTIIMARTLGPDQYGVFSALTALASIAYSLGDLGVSAALINFIPKLRDKRQTLINTSFWFQFLVAILIFVIFGSLSFVNQKIVPNSTSTQLLLAGLLSFNYLLIGYSQGIFTAERRFWSFSISQIVDATLKILLIVSFVYFTKLDINLALLANIFSTFVAIIVTCTKDLYQVKKQFDRHIFYKMFAFAKWIAFSRFFSVLFSKIDIVLLNLLSTSHNAGIFAAASRVTLLFALLVSSLNSVVNPRFSSFDSKKKVVTYIRKLTLFIAGIAALMLLCVALANPIITIVFGNKYLEAIPVFQYMTLAMIPFLFTLVTTPAILYTYNQPKFYAFTTAMQVITVIVIEVVTIPTLGNYSPVIALGFTNVVVLLINIFKLKSLITHDRR